MSPLPLLTTTASFAVVLAFVATLAPLASRKATCAAAVLGPVLAWMAWRLFAVIAPLGAISEARDPVESLDLWLLAVASMLGLAALGCVLRVGLAWVVRAQRHGPKGYPAR